MKQTVVSIMLSPLMVLLLANGSHAQPAPAAGDKPLGVLVVTNDSDKDTTPRGNSIEARVRGRLQERLAARGLDTFDPAVLLGAELPPRLGERDLTERIMASPKVQSEIDMVILVQIYTSPKRGADGKYFT